MSETTPSDAAASPPSDLVCRRCGYELRGHDLDDRCPECGTPVILSTRGDAILDQDPAWVRRLARGAGLVELGLVMSLILVISTSVVLTQVRDPATPGAYRFGLISLYAIAITLMVLGAALLTAKETNLARLEPLWSARRVARAGFVVTLPLAAGWLLIRDTTGRDAIATLFLACSGITTVAACQFVVSLAARLPRAKVYRKLKGAPYVAVVACLGSVVIAIWFLPTISTPRVIPPGVLLVAGTLCVFGVICVVFTVAFAMTPMRRELRAVVREQRRYARERS